VAAQRQHAGSLHAADAAADDVDGLRIVRLFDIVLVPLHHFGVDRAARQMQGVAQILIIRHALVVAHIEAAVVTEDARADIVLTVLKHLGEPLRVGQEIPRKARAVQPACGNGLRGSVQRHAARADNGNVDELFDVLDLRQIAVFGHIHRRVRPEPRIVRSKQGLELFVHKQPPVNVLAVWGGKRLYMMVVSVSFPYFIIQFEIGRLYTL